MNKEGRKSIENERSQPSPLGIQANDLIMYFKLLSLPAELVCPSFEYHRCGIDEIVVDVVYSIYPFCILCCVFGDLGGTIP